jgi:hypothetical protein
MKRILLLFLIVIVSFPVLRAQNTCADQLKVAQRSFDDGLLDDIPQLLAGCMKDGFTREEKTNAYKLLIQTYLFSENTEKADEVMMKFLSDFPSYAIATNDPKEFINLYGTYRTKPIFKIEAKGGITFCMPSPVQFYGTGDISKKKPTYKSKVGYNFELNYINTLYKNFDYSIGVAFTLTNLSYSNNPNTYSTVTGLFNNMYLGLPVAVRYNFNFKGVNLFAKAGFETVYLMKSSVDLTRTDNIVTRQEPFKGTEDLLASHRKIDIRPLFALGASFKVGRNWLNLSAGFKFSTMIQTNPKKYYSNNLLMEKYFFAEDDLLLNQSYLSVSIIRPIYKPKKLK